MPAVDLKQGNFSWVDLMTTDAAGAKAFYGSLFGWTNRDEPTDQPTPYTMFSKGDDVVAGMGVMSPEMEAQGMRPVWNSYILVEDVDAMAGKATELGATVLWPPMDAMDAGRMCMIQDPTGGMFALWQEGNHCGAGVFNEHGALSWNELVSKDQKAAIAFYEGLLGWGWDEVTLPDGTVYKMCTVEGRPNGGVMQMTDEWPPETPSHWAVYFQVDDVDTTLAKAMELGGSTHVPPMDISVGRFAVLADPQGGIFTIFTPSPMEEG